MKSAEQMLREILVGKVLKRLEYAEDGDSRTKYYGKIIKRVNIGQDECREDGVVWLDFEGGGDVMVYGNEGVETELRQLKESE